MSAVRRSVAAAAVALGVPLLVGEARAGSGPATVPGAAMYGSASGCYSAPCAVNDGSTAATSVYGVPVASFGRTGSYTLTEIYPGSGSNGNPFVTLTPNTPGYVTSVGVGISSVTLTGGDSGFAIAIDRDSPSGGAQGAAGELNYDFELVQVGSPTAIAPVTIGVTAKGGFSGSVSEDSTANPSYNGDGAFATSSLLIDHGSGQTVLSEIAQTSFDYLDNAGSISDTLIAGQNSPNAQVSFGVTSTFSASFAIDDTPITVNTDTVYNVQLYGTINGGAILDASLYDDPQFVVPEGYELLLSPDVSNGVPEPAAWTLMLVGAASLGGALRLARKAPSSAWPRLSGRR